MSWGWLALCVEQQGGETGTELVRPRAVGLKVEERQEPDHVSLDFTECGERPAESWGEWCDLSYILASCSCWEVRCFFSCRGQEQQQWKGLRGCCINPGGKIKWNWRGVVGIGIYIHSKANRIYWWIGGGCKRRQNQVCCLLRGAEHGGKRRALAETGALKTCTVLPEEACGRLHSGWELRGIGI